MLKQGQAWPAAHKAKRLKSQGRKQAHRCVQAVVVTRLVWVAKKRHHIHLLTFLKKVQPRLEIKGSHLLPELPESAKPAKGKALFQNDSSEERVLVSWGSPASRKAPVSLHPLPLWSGSFSRGETKGKSLPLGVQKLNTEIWVATLCSGHPETNMLLQDGVSVLS